jgi:hypothetical protein
VAEGTVAGILHSGSAEFRTTSSGAYVLDVTAPSGIGARFDATGFGAGQFITFLSKKGTP